MIFDIPPIPTNIMGATEFPIPLKIDANELNKNIKTIPKEHILTYSIAQYMLTFGV